MNEDGLQLLGGGDPTLLVLPEVEGDPAAEPLEVAMPVEEGHVEAARAPLDVEADAFEAEEHGVLDGAGHRVDLGLPLEHLEALVGEKIAHLPGHPLHAFEFRHAVPPSGF